MNWVCAASLLFASAVVVCSSPIWYESLYRGGAYTSDAVFPGEQYWTSEDGEWRAFAYTGIRYASAKRFEPSTLNRNHDYLRNTSQPKRGFVCPQIANEAPYSSGVPLPLNEDCLYLDIYIPPVFKNHQNLGWSKWPVLMWIHGGQFKMGHKDAYSAGNLAMSSGNIVVVPNYRLGPFGFLSTGDHVASGNWALYDLKLAVKWVHNNIQGFGGEKTKLTLAGERAGAALVSMLLLDDDVRGLVHGAVTFSGNMFSPWAVQSDPAAVTKRLAIDVGCSNDTKLLTACLKRLTTVELLDSAARVERQMTDLLGNSLWAPVVDGLQIQFLPSWLLDGPTWVLKGGYVTGYSTNDAAWPLLKKIPRVFGHGTIDQEWIYATFIPSLLEFVQRHCDKPSNQQHMIQTVYDKYGFLSANSPAQLTEKILRLTNDVFFVIPAIKESSMYAKQSSVSTGNQLFVISSDDSYETRSISPNPETAHLFGLVQGSTLSSNRSIEAVSRELRRLVGHIVRYGTGFGTQFNQKLGNQIILGNGHEWQSTRSNMDELLKFWEPLHKAGCA
ncbi:carboxylesterase 5A-like [Paramacrobiotus metropolitanus]|uniref:carboxylesterase 5A-like n=1 Tax=Paramacrobiotus metropolitanus TaxID=2943436 RepID=UPI002446294D|nr:carboxylesterase 5A-like [Paramacrobiotus metropolitanus]